MEPSCWESLKQWYIKRSPWIAGGLVLFNAAFFAGVLFVGAGRFLTDSAVIGWVGAAGTFAAAIAAVGIAIHASNAKKADEVTLGKIEALSLAPVLQSYIPCLRILLANLQSKSPPPDIPSIAKALTVVTASFDTINLARLHDYSPALAGQVLIAKETPATIALVLELQLSFDMSMHIQQLELAVQAGKWAQDGVSELRKEFLLGPLRSKTSKS